MDTAALSLNIQQDTGLLMPGHTSLEEIKAALTSYVNELINKDFEKLVSLLYRIDVNEHKMRNLLNAKQGENAAGLIADLIIERQLQKIESRKKYSSRQDSDEEKW